MTKIYVDAFVSEEDDSSMLMLLYVLGLLQVAFASYAVYMRFFHALASVPGPFWASLTRCWIINHVWTGDMHRTAIALHQKYGPIVRIGPNEVSIADPSALKTIYGAGTKFCKAEWYCVWQGHRKFDIVAERDESIHRRQRALVQSAYNMTSIKDLEPYVDDCVRKFITAMTERQGQIVDMGKWVQLYAFDVIGEVTFSKSFGFLEAGTDDGSFALIQKGFQSGTWVGQVPWLFWLNERFMPWIGNHLAVNNRAGAIKERAIKEIAARVNRGSDRKDILAKLFAAQKEKPALDNDAIIFMSLSNIFGGSDTTAISTRAMIYFLLKHPRCMKRLVEEINRFNQEGKLSNPITTSEADSMPYLQAVMLEAMRIHPSHGMCLPREVPAGGATIAGTFLPEKTVVGINPWVIHRDKNVFGSDADDFRPERWLSDNEEMRRVFFTFGGSGPRSCQGRNISWMEMSKLLPTLFLHFDIELADPEAEWSEIGYWHVTQRGLNVKLTKRVV